MKKCTRFHVEDLELGDRLTMSNATTSVTLTVREKFKTPSHGWLFYDEHMVAHYAEDYNKFEVNE